FQQTNVDESTLQRWRNLFTVEDHSLWYEPPQAGSSPQPSPSGSDGESEDDENSSNSSEESPEGSQESDEEKDQGQGQDGGASSLPGNKQDSEQGNQAENEPGDSPGNDPSQASQQLQDDRYDYPQLRELESMWRDISEHVQTDLETFSKQHGFSPSRMTQALHALNREKADYTAFLRKFATMHEVMRLSPDEFDYIFYTYGLEMYHDMPLIEPLEYREDKRIRDFVIAIDTSGSVRGALVQNFLQKTYTILKQEETFDRKFNLHIIQCDADIQEDALITTQEEFDEYISHLRLHGFGGTDFRPVFEYVEQLRRTHAFQDLRGLLYFTDGYGTYPSHQTDYTTAFVFLDDDDDGQHLVPPWAVRVILETPDLEDTKR
ncbi:MAG: hypothetical protein IJ083_01095, partial [Clostridia bacterium]|nr:hypothetical protein [Clostridia bacterium]